MIWIGIGLIIIGIAFLGIAGALFKPLMKLADLFQSVQKTTDQLPETVETITSQATDVLGTGIDTLQQVNQQIKELSPIFHLIGDAGRATNRLTSSVLKTADGLQEKTEEANAMIGSKNLQGIYGLATIGYFLATRNK
ncbi:MULTISPECIES: DUF948 domain-containing protein [Oceanobacillus]|uniref:DUF948 domain-containing protein n=1 Tax=Oceanobacillus kimchii TaxID=746691 RepID=A0ABQ5TCR7_9BACI|nr:MULTISPECIES: DUF948 domain-containing protein [Oceanobacillus]MBT2601273.1 DUF948 domain-containing protein [Oceanobacillus sp. ISL-74]MBT2653336.1 DUF948 domain-containing protein [Oceanobacillus sp. ISL-73]MCT1579143.1 DUF948 domain-containing protein [Oceanobacillus kimchii]MCT2137944.1 DUF948 domain-containing protein [Oceanobacillus kimchii]OEH53086.1 hypothetical protein AQ616_17555 [Oceanobacillus sp. E9]